MKSLCTLLLFFLPGMVAEATEPSDSLPAQQLHEIVVQAPRVVRKADMDLYYPSQSAVEHSKNGLQLLNNLMIPTLTVTDALDQIQAGGRSVQLRINGRESSIDQVRALLPESVKRVEWIDNPGLRYHGADYVLNIIVANPEAGGSFMASARPALNQAWGFYMADAKFNSGRSQFEVGAQFKLTDKLKTHREYSETFTSPTGESVTRNESPLGGAMDNNTGRLWASYSYIKPDTTVFMVDINTFAKLKDKVSYNGLLTLSNSADRLHLTDSSGDQGAYPSFSVYLEQHFANKQMLVVDFKGSLYFGKSFSDYIEQRPGESLPVTDIHTNIKDRNRAYALEADYIKNWSNSRLTAGMSYRANRNRSVYANLGGQKFHQRQDRVYFFAEYFQRVKKFTFTAGIGGQYTGFHFKESDQGNDSWNVRPLAVVSYALNDKHQFRLSFESWQSAPSLDQTNIAPLQLDGFQWRIGNPELKTSNSYMLTLRYNFNLRRLAGTFGVRAFTSPNAITPLLFWDEDRLVTTYENSKGLQNLSFFLAPQIEIVPNWLMASGYLQYRMERMKGRGYSLHNNNWSGSANVQLMHWGFVLSGQYIRSQHDLWGEKISWGENLSVIDLSYTWKDWQFSAGMIMPFGQYDRGSKMLSKWNTNEQHMRLDMRLPYITVSYNVRWGRQKRDAQKRINADAGVESSSAGGR